MSQTYRNTEHDDPNAGGGRQRVGRRTLLLGSGTLVTAFALGAGPAMAAGTLKVGSKGPEVSALQQRLNDLAFWSGTVDGSFGSGTKQAVYALQKAAGLKRDGRVGPATRAALDRGAQPSKRITGGTGLEIDLGAQLLIGTRDGATAFILNTSTGSGKRYTTANGGRATARTPTGDFSVFRTYSKGWQTAPLGRLYRPAYFYKGWAIHGSTSIPSYPASHGCARISVRAMNRLWDEGWAGHGTRVLVY